MYMRLKRILISLTGVIITAISVGAFKFAALGVDPFQTFMTGMDALIPIGFGTLYVIINAVLLLFALAFDRHYIGISTLINLFLLGYVVDFTVHLLIVLIPEATVAIRVVSFLLGFVFLCLGSSMYMTADLGVSTYDAIALVCTNKWKLWKFRYIRITTDIACILLGVTAFLVSGGSANQISGFLGIGTVLTAFFMGPLIDLFNRKIAQPLLALK